MTPISPVMPGSTAPERIYAKDQPEYRPLPAMVSRDGMVTTRWKLTWRERITMLVRGCFWVQVLTFNEPLQPIKFHTSQPSQE